MSAALTDIGAVEHARRIVKAHDACVGAARDGAHAPGVALMRPRNDEAQAGANGVGSRGKGQEVQANCATRAPRAQGHGLGCAPRDAASVFHDRVAAVLGSAPDVIEPGRMHRFSTRGRPSDDAGWCLLFPDLLGGVFGCWRQSISETWSANEQRTMTAAQRTAHARQVATATIERIAEQGRQWAENARRIEATLAQCVLVTNGDPVYRYLCSRLAIDTFTVPLCLRLHPALAYWQDGKRIGAYPAMVAPIVAPDGRVLALHRTYLTDEGRKAIVPVVKKLTGTSGLLDGACIPLGQPLGGRIGIAEGIETALAARLGSRIPTVAAYSAGNLVKWLPPAGVHEVVVFGDNDRAGREAASTLQARMLARGIRCGVFAPPEDGADWCDVLQQRGALAESAS